MADLKLVSVVLATLALFLMVTLGQSFIMEIQLHESGHLNETFYTFRRNVPDATQYNFSQVKALCYTGRWRGYSVLNYTQPLTSSYGTSGSALYCIKGEWPHLSFRHYGNINTSIDAISLFPMVDMGGVEVYVDRSPFAAIQGPIKSLGWTGTSSWTLFEGNNFDGASDCLKRATYGHDFIDDLDNQWITKLNLTTVGSMFKGCPSSLNATYIQSMRDAWARQIHI